MRNLFQPQVLKSASLAALLSSLAAYPRLSLWLNPTAPIWYLEAVIFVCGVMLWAFVFAWHEHYTHRPVWLLRLELRQFILATLMAIFAATVTHIWLDPLLRLKMPDEYPPDPEHWMAALLFSLALTQLFLICAPFDWLMRMFKSQWLAAGLTALFGAFVLVLKINSIAAPMPPLLVAVLLAGRLVMALLVVWLYLRGGVFLVWWWTFLIEARHLPDFLTHH